ncbi:MAG: hypothetical protein Q8N47_26420, partial [Bryobacterales bacterium]|nr:hypothetical protein [Bryobacterales bacterium]
PPAARPAPPPRAPQPAGDLPAFFNSLPPRFRSQQWLMVFTATAVLGGLALLYTLVSVLARLL